MSKTAFVTGGTGFVGANVVRELLTDGWSVRALARAGSDQRNLADLPLQVVTGAVEDDLTHAMLGCDAVFHVAAHYTLWRADRDTVVRSNVVGTRSILESARRAAVPRVVYTSSVAAIGVPHEGRIANETFQSEAGELIGEYKRSKYYAEREAISAAAGGQDVVIVNPTTPLGPWDRKPTPTGEIIVRFLRGGMPFMLDTGLNFVDVRDVARGHLAAYYRGERGERYILGGENLSLRSLLDRVGAATGRRAPRFSLPRAVPLAAAWFDEMVLGKLGRTPTIPIDGVLMAKEFMYYDSSKAFAALGYRPGPLEDAIDDAVAWFETHGYLVLHRSNA